MPIIVPITTKQDRKAKRKQLLNVAAFIVIVSIITGLAIAALDRADSRLAATIGLTLSAAIYLFAKTRKAN